MISICITDYGNPEFTKQCIASLKLTTYKDKEILVRSNTKHNLGLGVSSNILAKKAKGDYLFFLNNDTLVKKDIFERLLETPALVVGCRQFDYSGKHDLGTSLVSLDKFGCPAGRTGQGFYPDGAIFINRKFFNDLGGFDKKIFFCGEDRDLCWRAWLASGTVAYQPKAVFYHSTRSAGGKTNYTRRYHSERNIIRTLLKCAKLSTILEYIFWSILELGFILFTNPKAIWKSYLPAYWWNIKHFKDTMRERKKVVKLEIPPFSKVIGKLHVLRTQGAPKWI